jgi:hypothetical protein
MSRVQRIQGLQALGLLSIIEKAGGTITKPDLIAITVPQHAGRVAYQNALAALVKAGLVQVDKQRHVGGRYSYQTITITEARKVAA